MVGIYAHRGASAEFPENTLAAFRRALELGAEAIDVDVHLSADGVPVVIHDQTVDRTTDGSGAVHELTVAELQALDAGGGERIPTLGDVLELVEDKLHVVIDLKVGRAADAVLRAIQGRTTRWRISSFDWEVLRYVRVRVPAAELWPLTRGVTDEAVALAKEIGAPALGVLHTTVTGDTTAWLKGHGLGVWVWTVNDPERARTCAGWEVVGICTDDPALLQHTLSR